MTPIQTTTYGITTVLGGFITRFTQHQSLLSGNAGRYVPMTSQKPELSGINFSPD